MYSNYKYYLIPKGIDLTSLKNESDKKNIVKHMSAVSTELIYQFCNQYERHKGGETDKKEEEELFYLEISNRTLKKKVNSRYSPAIEKLKDAGIIKSDNSYLAGEYSKSYTFSNPSYFIEVTFALNPDYISPTQYLEEPYKSLSIDFDCNKLTIDKEKAFEYISTMEM